MYSLPSHSTDYRALWAFFLAPHVRVYRLIEQRRWFFWYTPLFVEANLLLTILLLEVAMGMRPFRNSSSLLSGNITT